MIGGFLVDLGDSNIFLKKGLDILGRRRIVNEESGGSLV